MSRGGRRAGAGRPALMAHEKRVQMSISVAPETKEWMLRMAQDQGVPMGIILEELIKHFEESCNNFDLIVW